MAIPGRGKEGSGCFSYNNLNKLCSLEEITYSNIILQPKKERKLQCNLSCNLHKSVDNFGTAMHILIKSPK